MAKENETTILDIYEAMGATISDDGQSVQLPVGFEAKPFDIVLRVVPTSWEVNNNEPMKMKFGILLDPDYRHEYSDHGGLRFFETHYDESFELPIDQIQILKKER